MSVQETQNDSDSTDVPETYEKLQELSRGDRVTIHDTDYYVVIQNTGMRSFFMPDFPTLVTPNGTTRDLAFGEVPDSDACGVMWLDNIGETEPTADDLLAAYDSVSITENAATDVYNRLETTATDTCPHCGNDTSQFFEGKRDGNHTVELLKCNDSDDCGEFFVRERNLNPNETATATVQTFDDETKEIELSGAYREIITSRFKLDPRQRANEKWLTATELAEILEAKTTGETTHGRVERNYRDRLQWKDSEYSHKLEIEYKPVRFE